MQVFVCNSFSKLSVCAKRLSVAKLAIKVTNLSLCTSKGGAFFYATSHFRHDSWYLIGVYLRIVKQTYQTTNTLEKSILQR